MLIDDMGYTTSLYEEVCTLIQQVTLEQEQ